MNMTNDIMQHSSSKTRHHVLGIKLSRFSEEFRFLEEFQQDIRRNVRQLGKCAIYFVVVTDIVARQR